MQVRRISGTALAAIVTVATAGCGSGGGGQAGATTGPTQASIDPSRVSPQNLPTVPALQHSAGAIADASFGDCTASAGAEQVTGSVHNTTRARTDYVVTVSWTNATSDVLARSVVVLRGVRGGQMKDFVAKATVPDGATTCTFNVMRGSVR